MDKKAEKIRKIVLIVSFVIFIFSLTQTSFVINDFDGQKSYSSFSLLFIGCIAFLGGGFIESFIWLANPLYFISFILLMMKNKKSIYYIILAIFIASLFSSKTEILAAENGRMATIESLQLGYWLWLTSLLTLTYGAIMYYFKD